MSEHKTYDDGDWDKPTSQPAAVDAGEEKHILSGRDSAGKLHPKIESELADLKRQLAAAGESIAETRKYIAQLFDPEQRFDTSKQGRFVTETLNFADSAMADAQEGTATPPPASDVSALVEAVKPFMATWEGWLDSENIGNEEPFLDWLQAMCDSELLEANWRKLAAAALAARGGEDTP